MTETKSNLTKESGRNINPVLAVVLDLSNYLEIQEPIEPKIIMTCSVRLDKKTMLNMLLSEKIYINGKNYKVPEFTLLECLINRHFGETRINFEEIS